MRAWGPQQKKSDPVDLVRQLDPDAIRRRLLEMENDRKSLLALLRAALIQSRNKGSAKEASHA
jgi:hypothetical protein